MNKDTFMTKINTIANRLNHKLKVTYSDDGGANVHHDEYGFIITLYPEDAGNEALYIREALTLISEKHNNNNAV